MRDSLGGRTQELTDGDVRPASASSTRQLGAANGIAIRQRDGLQNTDAARQYSAASMIVRTRTVWRGSLGSSLPQVSVGS